MLRVCAAASDRCSLAALRSQKADQKGVDRKLVKGVVQKWFKYMKEKKAIDDIFAKFDTNGSGVLERDQLFKLLKCYCANPEPDEGDVDFVLEKADLSGTGTMRPEEVLPAIAVWKDLAEKIHALNREVTAFAATHLIDPGVRYLRAWLAIPGAAPSKAATRIAAVSTRLVDTGVYLRNAPGSGLADRCLLKIS